MSLNRVIIHSKGRKAVYKNKGKEVAITIKPIGIMRKTAMNKIENSVNHWSYYPSLNKNSKQENDDFLKDKNVQ